MDYPPSLNEAIQTKDMDILNRAIEAGAQPDENSLNLAIQMKNMDILNRVIGLEVKTDQSSLRYAIYTRNMDILNRVIELNAPINIGTLTQAIRMRDMDILNRVIGLDAKTDQYSLECAIGTGDMDILDRVIGLGAPINAESLNCAIKTKNIDIFNRVLGLGAQVNISSLNQAIQTKDIRILKAVIGLGAPSTPASFRYAMETEDITIQNIIKLYMIDRMINGLKRAGYADDSKEVIKKQNDKKQLINGFRADEFSAVADIMQHSAVPIMQFGADEYFLIPEEIRRLGPNSYDEYIFILKIIDDRINELLTKNSAPDIPDREKSELKDSIEEYQKYRKDLIILFGRAYTRKNPNVMDRLHPHLAPSSTEIDIIIAQLLADEDTEKLSEQSGGSASFYQIYLKNKKVYMSKKYM